MIPALADLLVIGGLTVDRFADGSSAPGGSVMHIARAAAPRGVRVAIITVTGPEPEAQAGLDELRQLAVAVEQSAADATTTFNHRAEEGGRRLRVEGLGGRVQIAGSRLLDRARTMLLTPIADEVATQDLPLLEVASARGAILQGWVRSLGANGEVRPLPLAALETGVVSALGRCHLLVASREDLLAEASDPSAQLLALRRWFGSMPELLITDGERGVWTEHGHLPVPRLVTGVPDVGAGDVFAAFVLTGSGDPSVSLEHRAQEAMVVVADVLERRRA